MHLIDVGHSGVVLVLVVLEGPGCWWWGERVGRGGGQVGFVRNC